MTEVAKFGVNINDTISSHNIYINIRNTTDYPNSNIYIFAKTIAPTGVYQIDTVEFFVADEYGKWFGKGFGFLRDNQFLYKHNIRFPVKGLYQFELQQAMRTDQLVGVANVGLRVEKNTPK